MEWDGTPEGWGRGVYRKTPWSKYVLGARDRHRRDLARSLDGDPDFPYYFDPDEADRAIWFFNTLRLVEGEWAGKKWELADWQEWDILRVLFGWKRRDNGRRRFRQAWIEIPRKNAKSTLAGGIATYLLLADKEPRAQVYSAATKEDQASIVWGIARDMLKATPEFRDHVEFFKKSIFIPALGAVFKPLGRDSDTQDGFSVHGAVVDEYHAHKTSDMLDVLKTGRGARKQPLIVIITTAGNRSQCPAKKESDRAKRILEGSVIADETFSFVSCPDDPLKWDTEEEWKKANPNLGISIYFEGFKSDFKDAQSSATDRASFMRKQLNIWTGDATRWLSMEAWRKCGHLFDPAKLKGLPCWAGLDCGRSKDLTAVVYAFKIGEQENAEGRVVPIVYWLPRFWIPSVGKEERHKVDGVNYPNWVDEGFIFETPGEVTKYEYVREQFQKDSELFDIREIVADPAHAHELLQWLGEDDGFNVVKHHQSFSAMNFPTVATEELIIDGRLRHGNNPVLEWQAGNAVAIQDHQERLKLAKDKSEERIDGIVAGVMATGRLLIAPESEFVYKSRGIAFA
jgi:phage terminase large subunit-like protein